MSGGRGPVRLTDRAWYLIMVLMVVLTFLPFIIMEWRA